MEYYRISKSSLSRQDKQLLNRLEEQADALGKDGMSVGADTGRSKD